MSRNSLSHAVTWLLIALVPASLTRADVITVGSQTGAQIFFNVTLPRTYNFGVTQTGADAGMTISSIDVNIKRGNVTSGPVFLSILNGLGGTGSILATGTLAASAIDNQFAFMTVPISPITLQPGGYSVLLTTTTPNGDTYFIKNGATKLTTNGTSSVTTSYWVEDTNTEGTAGTTLNAASPVLATWTLGTNAYRFGNYRVGTTLSSTTAIVNTAIVTSNTMTQALAATGTTTGGVNSLTGLPSPYLSVGGTSNVVTGLNGATTGPNSGTATLTFNSVPGTSNTTGTTAVGSGAITLSGTGYNWATAAYSGSAFAFGYIHRGGAATSGTVAIGNQTVVNASYQDSLDVSASTGNPLVSASGFTGLAASAGGATRNNLVVSVGTGTAGSLNSTLALSLVSNANGVAGLSNGVASVIGSPGSITTSGTVFTGQSTWNTNGGGEWGTLASNFGTNWNWTTFDGSPGVDAGFTNTDTATFGSAVTSGTATVTVTAATPSIRALTFDNASASYGLAGASGGSLALLNAGSTAAAVTAAAGTHSISLPVSLGSDTSWSVASGARLGVSGVVSGLSDVTKIGIGTLVFSGNNTYAGTTTVSAGTLVVNGNQSAATGAMSVAAGATLAGSGVIGGDTTVAGIHTPGNSPGIQTVDGNLTYEAGSTVVWELINDTLLGRGTNYDGIDVTGALSFSGATSLNLVFNLAGSGVSWADSFWDSSYTGTNGWLVYDGASSLTGFGNLAISGTNWADGSGAMFQTARPGASFGLYQDGSDVYLTYIVAVPEPSTLILAGLGLAAIAAFRRRRLHTSRLALAAALALVSFAAQAQTTVTLNATSGTNVISQGYSTSGGLTLNMGFLMDVLAVGGGGGGGARFGGGGGAGGVLHQTNVLLGGTVAPTQTIGVAIGQGGTGGVASGGGGTEGAGSGGNGGNSLFGTLTAFGGGGGGRGDAANGAAGGSGGGGAGRFASSGGAGTAGQGNNGGSSTGASPFGGAGGGGAGGVGATAGSGAAGGSGRVIDISGASVTYGGGGGGGGSAAHSASGNITALPGAGGSGGGGRGGNGDNSLPAVAGTANTGGGGGGSAYNPTAQQYTAAGGGSGIVIVRYQGAAAGTGGTVTSGTGTAAGYTLHTFTTTGSTSLDLSALNLNTRLGAKVTGVITGNGSLTYNGPGKLILSNNSTFSGSTTITAGTLQLGDGSTQGAINSSAVVNNGTLIFNRSNALRFEAVVSGSGSLVQQGTGRTTLSGSNTFSGGTTINAGSVVTTAANRLPTAGLVTVGGSTSLTLGGNQTLGGLAGTGTVSIAGFRLTLGSSSGTFGGRIVGTGGLTKIGAGTLTLSGSNSFTGDTFIDAGTLVIANTRALDPFAIVTTATGSTLQVNQNTRIGYYENNGTLTGSGTLTSAYTLTNSGTLGSVIADDGGASGVLKRTAGTSVLDAANTYTGPTRIQAGRLELGTAGSVAASSSLIVEPTGEFASNGKSPTFTSVQNNGVVALGGGTTTITQLLSGTGTIDGNVAVTGLHSPGNSPGVEAITGNLSYGPGATVLWEITANTTTNSPVVFDQIVVGGDLAFNASTSLTLSFDSAGSVVDWSDAFWDTNRSWTLWDVTGSTSGFGNLSIAGTSWLDGFGESLAGVRPQSSFSLSQQGSDVVLRYEAVPEPSTLILAGLGLAAVAAFRRRR